MILIHMRFACAVSAITLKPTLTHPADFGKVKEEKDTAELGTCSLQLIVSLRLI